MIHARFDIGRRKCEADLNRPIDISVPLSPEGPRAWYVDKMKITPVRTAQFTGSVAEGGGVNFRDIFFNPHGHGTHTETVGHIDREITSVNAVIRNFFFPALLITVSPAKSDGTETPEAAPGDLIIGENHMPLREKLTGFEALVVRTLPNTRERLSRNYSNTNPAYFSPEALLHLRKAGIRHLLTDLPSVDREEDGGALRAHRAFWKSGLPGDAEATITEFIFVPDTAEDGAYLLNLQTAPFENDASPSRPVLFPVRFTD